MLSKWSFDAKNNLIEIFEIPYTTTIEAIVDKVAELVRQGRIREIADMRDESDKQGLKLTIDLKRGIDPDKIMQKLFKMTPLQDNFSCNFNILIEGNPRVLGVSQILDEWIAWRTEGVRRQVYADIKRKGDKLHKLRGLKKILLDIDRAIKIIRETSEESEVVPNLMIGFGIDEIQAEYVAEIKLRNINKEYILKRVSETDSLELEIEDLKDLLNSKARIQSRIIATLREIDKKYSIPRKTDIIFGHEVTEYNEEEHIEDYPVNVFLTRHSYFKKITVQSLRMSGEQKMKDDDVIVSTFESQNRAEILFFNNMQQVYKAKLSDFDDTKASVLGDYLPAKLGMDDGEQVVFMCDPGDYSANLLFVFENGKVARVAMSGYETKTNRKRLTGAYSDKSPLVCAFKITEEDEIALYTTENRALIFHSAALSVKSSRATQGVAVMTVKTKYKVNAAYRLSESSIKNAPRYKFKTIPAAGARLNDEDRLDEQMTLI
ncbi:MAG: DNA gyrase subunit A [Clostridia bacterium]